MDTTEYGKKSLGKWILIYVVLGLIVYGVIYYFYMMSKSRGYSSTSKTPTTEKASSYKTGAGGMTLYVFDKDSQNLSNCYDACAANWPPYLAVGTAMPEGMTTVTRMDGSMQYTLNGRPLYYYIKDVKAGDTLGDGVQGTWYLAK